MNILIIEDELPAAKRLHQLASTLEISWHFTGPLQSIEDVVKHLQTNGEPDLYLMDIELADGQSFEIFKEFNITKPVVFTTAYHEYAIQAFKANAIDYLLKPIDTDSLRVAFDKFKQQSLANNLQMDKLLQALQPMHYRKRFLLKKGNGMVPIESSQIAYFFASDKFVFLRTLQKETYVIELTLDQLEQQLDPAHFFRVNRKYICASNSITEIRQGFNSKLRLILQPAPDEEVNVSRERGQAFKTWMNQ